MEGLSYSNRLIEPDQLRQLTDQLKEETETMKSQDAQSQTTNASNESSVEAAQILHGFDPPTPPDLMIHQLTNYSLEDIWPYINPQMLYVRHLGYRGRWEEAIQENEPTAISLQKSVEHVKNEILSNDLLTASALFKFFPCNSQGEVINIKNPKISNIYPCQNNFLNTI